MHRSDHTDSNLVASVTKNVMLPPGATAQPPRIVTATVKPDCCAHRGEVVGRINCNCQGRPALYACRSPDVAKPYCLLHATGKRIKGLDFLDGTSIPIEPGQRVNELVPTCSTCQARQSNSVTVIPRGGLRFFRTADLYEQTYSLLQILPAFSAVVAVPRSGMIPASLIATARHVPLFTLNQGRLVDVGHGLRGQTINPPKAPYLLVDDTTWSGAAMRRASQAIRGKDLIRAAVYAHSTKHVDYCATVCESDFLVEWNLFNNPGLMRGHSVIQACRGGVALDFDGVICEEPRVNDHRDLSGFLHWLSTAKPMHLPLSAPVKMICSGRLEGWRHQTMNWLARYGVRVSRLLLDPARTVEERDIMPTVAARKGAEFRDSDCTLFVESDLRQCPVIQEVSGKTVVHLLTGKVYE